MYLLVYFKIAGTSDARKLPDEDVATIKGLVFLKAYKVLGKTLIYYVSSASEDFRTVYPGVISEVAPYILKDVVPTKYFGKKQKTGTSAK